MAGPRRIGVFGLGNVLRKDDGFGPAVIRRLEARYVFPEKVELRDLGTPGLDLAGFLGGFDMVVIADTIAGGVEPGAVTLIDATDHARASAALRLDTHAAGLREALWLTQLHGNAPKRVVLVGTAPSDLEQGAGLSVAVETAVESTVEQILELLAQAGIHPTPRPEPTEARGWWEA
ncbi:MAG: hydrogenase maturation protease [Planctomycetota bacterium]